MAQLNLPREFPQITDAIKGAREQPKPPAPVQSPPAARESQPAESQTPQSQQLIASGISPETRVREEKYSGFHSPTSRNYSYVYTGTVREIKENWCEAGLKKITGDVAARHAPYRQHKLLGTTQKEYCGDPPASAYR